MNEINTPKVIAGSIHHLSVRNVRSEINARPAEKTPVLAFLVSIDDMGEVSR
jgi:hypothetical protein